MIRITPIFILLFSLSGCLPYLWVTPPAKFDIAGGLTVQSGQANDVKISSGMQASAGIYPLQVFPDYFERTFDSGIGYSLLYVSPNDDTFVAQYFHGPYLDLIYFVPIEANIPLRMFVSGKGMAVLNTPKWGAGLSGQVGIEIFDFTDNDFETCSGAGCNMGRAYGESSFALFLEGSQLFYGDQQLSFFGFGLSFRSPATTGIGWAIF